MKDWRLDALPDLVAYLLVAAALLGLFVGLAIRDVDRQLNRARYLSRARFTSKIDRVTDR
jgi:hypothetical protein